MTFNELNKHFDILRYKDSNTLQAIKVLNANVEQYCIMTENTGIEPTICYELIKGYVNTKRIANLAKLYLSLIDSKQYDSFTLKIRKFDIFNALRSDDAIYRRNYKINKLFYRTPPIGSTKNNIEELNSTISLKRYGSLYPNYGSKQPLYITLERGILPKNRVFTYKVIKHKTHISLRIENIKNILNNLCDEENLDNVILLVDSSTDDEFIASAFHIVKRLREKYQNVYIVSNNHALDLIKYAVDKKPFLKKLYLLGHSSRKRYLCLSPQTLYDLCNALDCHHVVFYGCHTASGSMVIQNNYQKQLKKIMNDDSATRDHYIEIISQRVKTILNDKHTTKFKSVKDVKSYDDVNNVLNAMPSFEKLTDKSKVNIEDAIKFETRSKHKLGKTYTHTFSHGNSYKEKLDEFSKSIIQKKYSVESFMAICIDNQFKMFAKGFTEQCNINPKDGLGYNTPSFLFDKNYNFNEKKIRKIQNNFYLYNLEKLMLTDNKKPQPTDNNMLLLSNKTSTYKDIDLKTFNAIGYSFDPEYIEESLKL